MTEEKSRMVKAFVYVVVGLCASLIALWTLGAIFRAGDPNLALAQVAERSIQMAEDARRDAERARAASSRVRVLALALGVTAPLIVVYLIYRASERAEPTPAELLDVLEREKLLDLGEPQRRRLQEPGAGELAGPETREKEG